MKYKVSVPGRRAFHRLILFSCLFIFSYFLIWGFVPTWQMAYPSAFEGLSGVILKCTLVVGTISYIVLVAIMSYFCVLRKIQASIDKISNSCDRVINTLEPDSCQFDKKANYRFFDVTMNVFVGSLLGKIKMTEEDLGEIEVMLKTLPEKPSQEDLYKIRDLINANPNHRKAGLVDNDMVTAENLDSNTGQGHDRTAS